MSRQRLFSYFSWTVITVAAAVVLHSLLHLPLGSFDVRFLVLVAVTLCVTSRASITIPHVNSSISVSDTLIFLTMMLYGGEAAILLNAAETALSSRRFCKSNHTVAFNASALAFSTYVTTVTLRLCYGSELDFGWGHGQYFSAICVMALVQYGSNSGIIALACSLRNNKAFWATWYKHYLWTSITYFAGASAAGVIVLLMRSMGASALLIATPIIFITYFTYRTYLKNVETSNAQAEQARRHVEELSHYIAEQERIREQYAQIEKLSALGELASGVAHDFNNTLAGILGRAQLLLSTKDPEKIEAGLRLIIKTAKDGAKTIKRIQDFARQRRDHDFQPVSVDQLLLDVREITRPRWKSRAESEGVHINLELQLGSDDARVMGDESELREVLVNLVFNAVDAMPQGGTLTLSAREGGGVVEIAVADTGEGMSEEVRSRVFDPFFTTKGKAGMGLGLAVSYGIVRRHEGGIEAESEAGRGTTFRIKLPAAKSTARPETATEPPAITLMPQRPGATRILVVDDEENVRELLRDILESEGYQVGVASGGREALELLGGGAFDAVFTDLGMQGMSGWELAHAVRELNRTIPLAVITGWGEAVGSGDRSAAQVDWVIPKPFDTAQILGIAREVGRRAEARAQGIVAA
jgi:signal transduction histidine kinase/ActR/RegA family two-component response regulator